MLDPAFQLVTRRGRRLKNRSILIENGKKSQPSCLAYLRLQALDKLLIATAVRLAFEAEKWPAKKNSDPKENKDASDIYFGGWRPQTANTEKGEA